MKSRRSREGENRNCLPNGSELVAPRNKLSTFRISNFGKERREEGEEEGERKEMRTEEFHEILNTGPK